MTDLSMALASAQAVAAEDRRWGIEHYVRTGAVLCAVLVFGLGGWAMVADISSAVIASGTLSVETSPKKVQHPTGGIVGEILVREGDAVKEGDVVARLDDTMARANLAIVERQLDALQGRAARLDAEKIDGAEPSFPAALIARASGDADMRKIIDDERRLFETRRAGLAGLKSQLAERILQTREEISGLSEQLAARGREITLIQAELEGVESLYKQNLVGISRRNMLERDTIRLGGEYGSLRAAIAQAKGRIAESELQIIRSEQEFRGEALRDLRETESRIAELLERRIAALDQLNRVDIRAPQTGVVHQRNINTVGGVVGAGELLMQIVPVSEDLVIEVRMSPIDRDQIHEGQTATVRFPALNQRITPEVTGILERISADVTHDQTPGMPPQSFYSGRIRLPASEAAKLGSHRLRPGMPAEAYIQSDSRSAMSYFIRPITDNFARAFRER